MDKIFIIHFQPLEKYPPVMNLLRVLSGKHAANVSIHVISTEPETGKKSFEVSGIQIYRPVKWKNGMGRWQRMMLYAQFNRKALSMLRSQRPEKVLYYETLSAFAPCVYKRYFNTDCELFIHYHEYTSPQEYATGMILNRWLHNLERKIYKKAHWVSHTNEYRLNLFINDLKNIIPPGMYTLPNYPPESWKSQDKKPFPSVDGRIGFVYVGALSLSTMFVKEFAYFIKGRPDKYYWDVYSDNFQPAVLAFMKELDAPNIRFKGAVEYDSLPEILSQYEVGVILYKGHIPNYVYNAPNKLFEYLACGLDVWFPDTMKGSFPYITKNTRPEVKKVDFTNLADTNDETEFHLNKYPSQTTAFHCENALKPLITQLVSC